MAARYFLNIGTNYSDSANWSNVDGGVGGFSAPTNADDIHFTSLSGNCTVNVAGFGKTINFTGYIGTITLTNNLTISGNVTLDTGMIIAGAGGLIVIATATLTSNGKVWPNSLTFITTITITLADDWHIYGNATLAGTTGANTTTINGADMYCYADCGNSNGRILGTTKIILAGTGTVNVFAGGFGNRAIDINTSGTIIFISGFNVRNCVFTYIAGTVIHSGNMAIGSGCQLDLNVSGWDTVNFNGAGTTITLLSDLNCNTLSTAGFNNSILNGFSCYTNSFTHTGNAISGTTHLVFSGTGTWSGAGALRLNTTINTIGTLTVSGSVAYYTGTLTGKFTYISGTVITTGSTLNVAASATFDTDGMVWNNVTFLGGSTTTTLLSDFYMNGTCLISAARTFNGFTMYCGGDLTVNASNFGTSLFVLNGTGTITTSIAFTRTLNINTTGTITLSGTVLYYGNLSYTAGTVISTGATLSFTSNVTLDTGNIVWDNVLIGLSGTITTINNTTFKCNIMTLSGTGFCTFQGTAGFTCNTFISTTAGRTIRLTASNTYTVNTALTLTATSISHTNFVSLTSAYAKFDLAYGATQNVQYINATYIDSSNGQTIYDVPTGTLNNTINWSIHIPVINTVKILKHNNKVIYYNDKVYK